METQIGVTLIVNKCKRLIGMGSILTYDHSPKYWWMGIALPE